MLCRVAGCCCRTAPRPVPRMCCACWCRSRARARTTPVAEGILCSAASTTSCNQVQKRRKKRSTKASNKAKRFSPCRARGEGTCMVVQEHRCSGQRDAASGRSRRQHGALPVANHGCCQQGARHPVVEWNGIGDPCPHGWGKPCGNQRFGHCAKQRGRRKGWAEERRLGKDGVPWCQAHQPRMTRTQPLHAELLEQGPRPPYLRARRACDAATGGRRSDKQVIAHGRVHLPKLASLAATDSLVLSRSGCI